MRSGVLLYDADCGLCTRAAGWLAGRERTVRVEPLQAHDLASLGVDAERALREIAFRDDDGTLAWGALAIARALAGCGMPWRAAGLVIATQPAQVVARPVYAWVAANRYRLPGGSAACAPRSPGV